MRWRVIQKDVVREMRRVLKSKCIKRNSDCDSEKSVEELEIGGRVFIATDAECFDSWTRQIFSEESCGSTMNKNSSCMGSEGAIGDDITSRIALTPKTNAASIASSSSIWKEVIPCPDRKEWLPIVSYYERKGVDRGHSTMMQCWQLCV